MIATNFVSYSQMSTLKAINWGTYTDIRNRFDSGDLAFSQLEEMVLILWPEILSTLEGEELLQAEADCAAWEYLLDELFSPGDVDGDASF
jgi:hypothetical protein